MEKESNDVDGNVQSMGVNGRQGMRKSKDLEENIFNKDRLEQKGKVKEDDGEL